MRFIKKFFRAVSIFFAFIFSIILSFTSVYYHFTADNYFVEKENPELSLPSPLDIKTGVKSNNMAVSLGNEQNLYFADITLFNSIPIRKTAVSVIPQKKVIPCAVPFGIELYTQGVLVVAMSDVKCDQSYINPAKSAGLTTGDVITHINDKEVNTGEEIAQLIENSDGSSLVLKVKRNDEEFETELIPVKSYTENCYKAGLWVRDSSAGIGTLTYYDPENNIFAGLGHGICDVDTGELMPLLSGDILKAEINDVVKGENGRPGELRGSFVSDKPIGKLRANTQLGVYGVADENLSSSDALPVGFKQEIKKGKAQILSTVDSSNPQFYDIEIEKINYNGENLTKNMVIKITSQELLEKTGGIVQGMSGSPIIQNGKLIGAVTHVFVNDPTRGYAIFAETMMEVSDNI